MMDGLDFTSTAELEVPDPLIEQVIGQQKAVEVITLAARQRRAVLLVGEPGTGKSMLAAAMAELMPAAGLEDIIVRANPKSRLLPRMERVPAGEGRRRVKDERTQIRREQQGINYLCGVAVVVTLVVGIVIAIAVTPYALAAAVLGVVLILLARRGLISAQAGTGLRLLI